MEKRYPISEIFGPTIQGEGPLAGTRTFFVRFAGCDYDCEWCDTKYAVNPKYPGWTKTMMTREEIMHELQRLGAIPHPSLPEQEWVTLSGGNPALFVDESFGLWNLFKLAIETQGSTPPNLLVHDRLQCIVVSPKPPSSGMADKFNVHYARQWTGMRRWDQTIALKYVVFNTVDLDWIAKVDAEIAAPDWVRRYLSAGTPLGALTYPYDLNTVEHQVERFARLADTVKEDPRFRHFTASLQQHVLLWGQKRGV